MQPKSAMSKLKNRHVAVLWLLFLALFSRGMLPSGTMLAFGADKVSVVLCTPQGALVQALDKNGQELKSHHNDTCPFAFALSMAAASGVDSDILFQTMGANRPSGLAVTLAPWVTVPRYSARAPPVLS